MRIPVPVDHWHLVQQPLHSKVPGLGIVSATAISAAAFISSWDFNAISVRRLILAENGILAKPLGLLSFRAAHGALVPPPSFTPSPTNPVHAGDAGSESSVTMEPDAAEEGDDAVQQLDGLVRKCEDLLTPAPAQSSSRKSLALMMVDVYKSNENNILESVERTRVKSKHYGAVSVQTAKSWLLTPPPTDEHWTKPSPYYRIAVARYLLLPQMAGQHHCSNCKQLVDDVGSHALHCLGFDRNRRDDEVVTEVADLHVQASAHTAISHALTSKARKFLYK